ncbi:Fic family protein [Raoultibacter timonensis]|uniref:Fic family protein n=1 Tax=Raoultibacter timonensis TaxID=1907662 RepID=UPI0026DAE592|nr:ATP-binding protein [Raoultibacter timonensis]
MIYDKIAETDQCEFKQELETGKPKSWLKTVCAFANGHGGVIVFGVRNDIETYSFDIVKATYYDRPHKPFESEGFVSFGLATRQGKLTNAGVLMADQWILRQNRIFCTRWNGQTKASSIKDALDDHEYEGCLLRLLNRGKDFVETHNEIGWTKTPDSRIEEPSYAPRAVEEAMVNALIHRDYLNGGAEVTIFVYDDRLEITSPGSKVDGPLPPEVDVTKITSQRRNPIIADLFQRLGFMERRGSGLRKIREETARCANYREEFLPLFIDDGHTFTVILKNMNYQSKSKPDQVTDQVKRMLDVLGCDSSSALEIMERLSLSHRPSFRTTYLVPALNLGLIERTIPDKPNSRLQKYRRIR